MAKPIGSNIKAARIEAGLTRRELAEKVGRSHKHIAGIETNRNTADPAVLSRIAKALGVPIEHVMQSDWVAA